MVTAFDIYLLGFLYDLGCKLTFLIFGTLVGIILAFLGIAALEDDGDVYGVFHKVKVEENISKLKR